MNPEVQERLRRLVDQLDRVAASQVGPKRSGRADYRLRGNLVPNVIMRVLEESVEPLSLAAIHEAVELVLGQAVARSTVKSFLAREARPSGRVVRLARGSYRLTD